jgi:hypothetical protein
MPLPLAPLLAAASALALYPEDAEAARFPWMSPERLKRLVQEFYLPKSEGKTQGALTMMRPSTFLTATTQGSGHEAWLAQQAGKFDPYKFQNEPEFPRLDIDPSSQRPEFYQHEGRHRMAASSRLDDRKRPVVLRTYGVADPEEWADLQGFRSRGQHIDGLGQGKRFRVGEVTPLNELEDLSKYLFDINVPLRQVGVSLKPEGPGFTPEDLEAFHEYIPFGRIPPPVPRSK